MIIALERLGVDPKYLRIIKQIYDNTWFSVAMVALMGASILYNTQKILHTYPPHAYVGAAVTLFASLMTMFWYILQIFLDR